MADMKYSENIVKGPLVESAERGFAGLGIEALHDEYGAGISVRYRCINAAGYSCDETVTDDHHKIMAFIGGNPANIEDFGAEIRICLGEAKEEHIITGPAVVTIPAGLSHYPLKVTKCDKPIVLVEVLSKR